MILLVGPCGGGGKEMPATHGPLHIGLEGEGVVIDLYHKNPRQITERQYNDLAESLDELGDLSGIVHDLNSNEVIAGNQRSRVFDINQCEVVVEHEQEPDQQGTVGLGYIIWQGNRYAYRQVRWEPKQCEMANIKANKLGGDWDFDTLANEFELDELLEWGFGDWELGVDVEIEMDYEPPESEAKGLRQFAVMLTPGQFTTVEEVVARAVDSGNAIDPDNPHKSGNALYWVVCNANT